MKIKVFSHMVDIGCGNHITREQAALFENTGLLDAADSVNIFAHYEPENYKWLSDRWSDRTNVNFKYYGMYYQQWFELTTVINLQEYVHSTTEEFYVLYTMHKSASHGPGGQQNCRHYLQYWNIENWRECVAKLDEGYETCGAGYLTEDDNVPPYNFYAGNFYWAKASYLRRCRRLKTPPENNFEPQFVGQQHHRYDAECWNGSGKPKWYDIHPGPRDRWYLPPEFYRKDMNMDNYRLR
jgi:hypothetical protein